MPFIDVCLHCLHFFIYIIYREIYKIYRVKYNIYKGLKKSVNSVHNTDLPHC